MKTRVMYHALHESGHMDRYLIQDLAMPASTTREFVEYIDSTLGIYPLWLCPWRPVMRKSMHPGALECCQDGGGGEGQSIINVGVWGPGPTDLDQFIGVNRQIEQKVRELGGRKWLYAQAYYTEKEFWEIYDEKSYNDLRRKYSADYLPSVFDKIKRDLSGSSVRDASWGRSLQDAFWSIWPMSGLYGVLKTLHSKEYLLR